MKKKEGQGRRKSDTRLEKNNAVKEMIEENPLSTLKQISESLNISTSMVQRIMNDDLNVIWCKTKWVPHILTERNKAIRMERCQNLIQSLNSRLGKSNLITIDEKFFYCRKLKPRNKIGSWVSASGDQPHLQTALRSPMEEKYLVIIAISQRGRHYFEILNRNESINSTKYVEFLKNLLQFQIGFENPILPENMRLQQDNARPHVSLETIRLLPQPPYSPEVNLCDAYLFPRLEALRNDFQTRDEIKQFLDQNLPNFTATRMEKSSG